MTKILPILAFRQLKTWMLSPELIMSQRVFKQTVLFLATTLASPKKLRDKFQHKKKLIPQFFSSDSHKIQSKSIWQSTFFYLLLILPSPNYRWSKRLNKFKLHQNLLWNSFHRLIHVREITCTYKTHVVNDRDQRQMKMKMR